MRFRARKTVRLGPVFFIFTEGGFSSWGVQFGPLRWNFSRGSWSVDTPGPGSVYGRTRRRRGGAR